MCHSPVSVGDMWSPEALAVAEAYACLRRALVLTDNMKEDALRILMARTREAAQKYPTEAGGISAQGAMNDVLEHFSIFCAAVMIEKMEVK